MSVNTKLAPSHEAKVAAEVQGLRYYHGTPCINCGNTLRYVSCKNCVECQRKRNSITHARLRNFCE